MNVKENRYFKKARSRASKVLKNKKRTQQLLHMLSRKLRDTNFNQSGKGGILNRLSVFGRLVRAYIKGEYRGVKTAHILMIVAAIIYFVTPLDLIPDFIPVTGFVDDFTVIAWVYSKLRYEIDAYLAWEKQSI
ncbi:MAG: YkvA family protein [Fulvivirga sp.]|nr:YkvA family protein [Fulvivirga sp.]